MITRTANFTEYIEVLEIARNMRGLRKAMQNRKMFHIFFIFDIKKLFEQPATFKKINRLHSDFYATLNREYNSYNFFNDKIDFK